MKKVNIAIDGPAGAGKSSISKAVAKRLGIVYVDTGAMYRACAVYAIENGIEITQESIIPHLDDIIIDINYNENGQQIILNGKDVSERIREKDATIGSSKIAVIPEVRLKLVQLQRTLASSKSVIMDGRDIGTYVLPDADLKIYLTASVKERARRRFVEMQQKGMECDINEVEKDIEFRDKNDSEREFAPLRCAEDAIKIDSSDLNFEEVCDKIFDMVEKIL